MGPFKLHTVYATPYPGLVIANPIPCPALPLVEREPDAGVQTKAASPHARGTRHEARGEVTSLAPATRSDHPD